MNRMGSIGVFHMRAREDGTMYKVWAGKEGAGPEGDSSASVWSLPSLHVHWRKSQQAAVS